MRQACTHEAEAAAWAEYETLSPALQAKVVKALRVWAARNINRHVHNGFDMWSELQRLVVLPAFGGPEGKLAKRPPTLKVRRRKTVPDGGRVAFARPVQNLIHVTLYPGVTTDDLKETLVHEVAHLVVGADRGPDGKARWHGERWQQTMRQGFFEAYGIDVPSVHKPRIGGEYAARLRKQQLPTEVWHGRPG